MEFKKGDRVIWDSGFGYEIGYFDELTDSEKCVIRFATGGIEAGIISEPLPYSNELVDKLTKRYGYEKRFSETF